MSQKGFLTLSERSKSKGFTGIIVLIVVLMLAGLGGAYYFGKSQTSKPQPQNPIVISQTPQPTATASSILNETSDWKTYTNTASGFVFKYPQEWREDASLAYKDYYLTVVTLDPPCIGICGGRLRGIYVSVNENKNKLTSKDYVQQIVIPQYKTPKILDKQPDYLINIDATVVNNFGGAGSPGLVVFISKGENIIELFSDGIDDVMVNKILSTFKFLP